MNQNAICADLAMHPFKNIEHEYARPIRVLVIDDHRTVLWGLAKLMESAAPAIGMVRTAANEAEAMAAVEADEFDIIVLDVQLGAHDGLELLPKLQQASSAKILILTALTNPDLAERAIRAGAAGIVHKAESADTLLSAISHVRQGRLWLDWRASTALVGNMEGVRSKLDETEGRAPFRLTRREREIISRVVQHRSSPIKVIADEMHVSAHTLRNHLTSIYEKLGLHSRLELFMYATERGLHRLAA